jgi:uncharacterized repeat protein (TIGR03803 family)
MLAKALAVVAGILLWGSSAWAGTETVLYTFDSSDGRSPLDYGGHLVRDSAGAFYGSTNLGGSCGGGVVFKLSGSNETILHDFGCGSDGSNVYGAVLEASGRIYGTTDQGGTCGYGTVFELNGGTETVLHNFCNGKDGGQPWGGLVSDRNGNLYGTTSLGGQYGVGYAGTVYEISSTGNFSIIYSFCFISNCADGNQPLGGLVMDSGGNLYGMTLYGGTAQFGDGVVFKLSKSAKGWKETVLHAFTGGSGDGAFPEGASLTLGTQAAVNKNVLLGVTFEGGGGDCAGGCGTVFELEESNSGYTFTLLYSFTGTGGDGAFPQGTLTSVNGKLFGTTLVGGSSQNQYCGYAGVSGCGTVFELTNKNNFWTETILYSFTGGSDGSSPASGLLSAPDGKLYGLGNAGGNISCEPPVGCGVVYSVTP